MPEKRKSETEHIADARARVLAAALPNVAFDGWTDASIRVGAAEAEVDAGLARLAFPRGGVDLALAFHDDADRRLAEILAKAPLETMRIREKVAFAVRSRLELVAEEREAIRRAAALFALPPYIADGARAVWRTADVIWTGIGDSSDDVNWYTKRATLSAVHSSVVLYWLGDKSEGCAATWEFLDRRIEDVMRFEKLKGAVRDSPFGKLLGAGAGGLLSRIRAPRSGGDVDTGTGVGLPGLRRRRFTP